MIPDSVSARPHSDFNSSRELDQQVAMTLQQLAAGDIAQARLFARLLAWRFPDFALGQLLSAELESIAAFQDVRFTSAGHLDNRLLDLMLEAQARLNAPQSIDRQRVPAQLIQLGDNVSDVILVDLQHSTLYQYAARESTPTLIRQHYIASGKAGFGKQVEGDNKTPLGVYRITGLRSDASLPDLYGSGALMLDYPNMLDRHLGRTGSGIWLHGVPHGQRSRSPHSSEGCVTMSNDHLLRLHNRISLTDSRVVLSDTVKWVSPSEQRQQQDFFQDLFRQYQAAWTSQDQLALADLYQNDRFLTRLHIQSSDLVKVSESAGSTPDEAASTSHYLSALGTIDVRGLSMFGSPSIAATSRQSSTQSAEKYIVMSARFGPLNEYQLTLFWTRENDGRWRIVTEHLAGSSI